MRICPVRPPALMRAELLGELVVIGKHVSGPVENALALLREAVKSLVAAIDDRHAEHGLDLAQRLREGRLADVAGFGGAPEMPLARQRGEIL